MMTTVPLTVGGDAGADSFTVMQVAGMIDIFQNTPVTGTPVQSEPVADTGPITLNGNGGNDTFTLDYSGGDPIPGGLTIAAVPGGIAQPTLVVQGVAAGTGAAPNFTLSSSSASGTGLVVSNASVDDTIDLSGVSNFNLFPDTGTGSLTVSSGSFTFNQDLGALGTGVSLDVQSGAAVAFGVTQHLNSTTVESGGSLAMLPAGGQVLDTNTLSDSGAIDLADNDLIVNTPASTADANAVEEAVAAGVTASATAGIIYSSTATTGFTLGVATANQVSGSLTTLDGQSIPSTAVVARYTLAGDANLDGTVDFDDLVVVAQNFNTSPGLTPPEWSEGDFNYDGTVNVRDYNELNANFNDSLPPSATVTAGSAYTLTFPTPPSGTAVRWDVSWGDGTFNSYAGSATSASHVFTDPGVVSVQSDAVTLDDSSVYGTYRAPAEAVDVASAGATPLAVTDSSPVTDYSIASDGDGDTVVTRDGTLLEDVPTSSLASLDLTGDIAEISVDLTGGDPLPAGGVFSTAGQIDLVGNGSSGQLVTDGNSVTLNGQTIWFQGGTLINDQLTGDNGVIALDGSSHLRLAGPDPTPQPVTVLPGATVIAAGNVTVSTLTVDAGGTFRMAESGASLLTVGSLVLAAPDAAGDNGGILDLSDNDMIAQQTPAATVETLLAAGYDGGLWDGAPNTTGAQPAAIFSSAAAVDATFHELGYEQVGSDTDEWSAASAFDGTSVSPGDVVIKYTVAGDTNLDGIVDSTDNSAIANGIANGLTGWSNGDFTYTGSVTVFDQNLAGLAPYYAEIVTGGVTINDVTAKMPGKGKDGSAVTTLKGDGSGGAVVDKVADSNGVDHPGDISVNDCVKNPTDDNYTLTLSVAANLPAGVYDVTVTVDGHKTTFKVEVPAH